MSVIRTESLTHYFGGLAAVKKVSLAVEPGELRAIIGPNGAGKTSLFNLLTGRFRPTSGSVYVHDREVTGWPPLSAGAVKAGLPPRVIRRATWPAPISSASWRSESTWSRGSVSTGSEYSNVVPTLPSAALME